MKFTTFLPLKDNDGVDLTREVDAIIRELALQFGVVSVEGFVEGSWMDQGTVYEDVSKKVSVVCDNSRIEEARSKAFEIGKRLRQLAVYFEVNLADGVEILRIEQPKTK